MLRAISRHTVMALVAGVLVFATTNARSQCILINPSFEIPGAGAQVFAGWNQFGQFGSTSNATHGFAAARVTGPNLGGWEVSGYWQPQDTAPGEQWTATVCAWHTTTKPLMGQSAAILNIEWRDAGGVLLSFESHEVMNASTPVDVVQYYTVTSGPAPAGTVTTRILLGVLQGPTDPQPDVYYDQSTFDEIGPPSIDDLQWNDFPGGTVVNFSGRGWRVKGPGLYGPGPNLFNNGANSVWVDGSDRLHVTIKNLGGNWYSSEVVLEETLGYGDYIFTTEGDLNLLDPHAVLGLFLWQYGPCFDNALLWWNPFNECDIEISRWNVPGNDIAQFVCQPWDAPGNLVRFDYNFSPGELTSHAFKWLPDRIEYRSWTGGPQDEAPGNYIFTWTYTGIYIPRPEQPRVHINLWQVDGSPSSDQEVILNEFTFVPECLPPHCDPIGTGIEHVFVTPSHLDAARPNPFNPTTTIGYTLANGSHAVIAVYDVSGRLVRTLVNEFVAPGYHETIWDGHDDRGNRVASGVYLYQLRASDFAETRKMVMLK